MYFFVRQVEYFDLSIKHSFAFHYPYIINILLRTSTFAIDFLFYLNNWKTVIFETVFQLHLFVDLT